MDTETAVGHHQEHRSRFRVASELAARQFWAIARRLLLELGIGRGQIRSWLESGRLHPRYPGVYAFGRPVLPVKGELASALLFAAPGSALTGLTGLWWMGLIGRRPDLIHIDAPGDRRSRDDLRIRHPDAIDRNLHLDLPVAALHRSLLVASETLRHSSLRLVLARAEFEHLLDLTSLQAALARGPRGAKAVRAAIDAHLPQLAHCANGFERTFILLCEELGLEIPEPNPRVGRYRPDMLWRSQRLIVELDGRDAHSTAAQHAADARRQSHLESLGYTVLRFSWREVEFERERVAAEVRAHLAGAWSPADA